MKSILVHIDASPRAAVRLALAQRLAARHGARLTALYAVLPSVLAQPWAVSDGMSTAAAVFADLDRDQRDRARAMVEQAAGQGALEWIDGGDQPSWSLLQHALYHDLVVLGQTDPDHKLSGPLPPDLVASTLVDCGRPTLLVPSVGAFEALPSRVLIAWKPTREAARAVAAALPWLRLAAHVDVAMQPAPDDSGIDHGAALARWLGLHGVAVVRRHGLGSGDVGAALLSLAADCGAELLVMGCYGHSRAREWALGGATRSILQAMTLPVLMMH